MAEEEQVDYEEEAQETTEVRSKGRGFRVPGDHEDRSGMFEGVHQTPGAGPAKCKFYFFCFLFQIPYLNPL